MLRFPTLQEKHFYTFMKKLKILQNLIKRPNQIEMENLGQNWEPYRGAAALFLWHFYNKVKIKTSIQ